MTTMIRQGSLVEATRRTHIGTETLLGRVAWLLVEEHEGQETPIQATVEGMVIQTRITGLPLPIEEERPETWMVSVEPTRWSRLQVIEF